MLIMIVYIYIYMYIYKNRESFNNFEHDANGYELDSVLTSTPAYILEIEKVNII